MHQIQLLVRSFGIKCGKIIVIVHRQEWLTARQRSQQFEPSQLLEMFFLLSSSRCSVTISCMIYYYFTCNNVFSDKFTNVVYFTVKP